MNQTDHNVSPVSEPKKRSLVGMAAAILSVLGMVFFCLYLGLFAYSFQSGPRPIGATDTLLTVSNIVFGIAIVVGLIGGAAGLFSLFQKNNKKTFGVIGIVLAALILCGSCGIYAWAFLTPK